MKRQNMWIVTAIAILLVAGVAQAGTEIDFSGQVRVRSEIDSKSFDTTDGTLQSTYLRTRVTADATISENTHAVVQFQDSRVLGADDFSGNHATGDAKNVDLHQAFLKIDHLWNNGPGLKAGRFEVALGNHRVFGTVGWHNVGRSWDGFQTWFDREKFKVDAFWLKRLELDNPIGNSDFDIFGANFKIKKANVEVFGFYENDALKDSKYYVYPETIATHQNLKRMTFGFYGKRQYKQFDFEANAAMQTGKIRDWDDVAEASIENDISAMMFTFEGGYTFDRPCKPRIAVGIDYTSGDDDLTDNDCKEYNNLYYTGHKFRGYMDYFLGSGTAGLMDMMVRVKTSPIQGWTVKGDLHLFSTAVDYEYDGDETKDVGTEFDLSVSTTRIAGVGLAAGGSVFMPKEAWVGMEDADTTFWGWLQLTANF